jgi:hypothetical protein
MPRGADFAFYPHPSLGALADAGVGFVGRYVSSYGPNDANGKNLVPAEAAAYQHAGMPVILYAEEGAEDMLGGRSRGVARAQHFAAVASALGMGPAVMFCCADWDVAPGQQPMVDAYLDGAASVVGRDRTGIYGSYYVVRRALDGGKARWAVQTCAWSGCPASYDPPPGAVKVRVADGSWRLFDKRALVRQYLTVRIGGASCDQLWAAPGDYGQWPRPGGGGELDAYRHEDDLPRDQTLWGWCTARGTDVGSVAEFSRDFLNAENERILDAYLEVCGALHDAGHDRLPMPAGLVIWTRNP